MELLTLENVRYVLCKFVETRKDKIDDFEDEMVDLEYDPDFNDLTNSIEPSMYDSEGDFINKLDNKSCIIMSLNCQSLQAKFSQIKMLVDTLIFVKNNTPIQVVCLQKT